jgi:hypothetical protein
MLWDGDLFASPVSGMLQCATTSIHASCDAGVVFAVVLCTFEGVCSLGGVYRVVLAGM